MSADGGLSSPDVGPRWLPAEAPLPVPEQDFSQRPAIAPATPVEGAWLPRAALAFGGGLLTAAFAWELYAVLSFVRMTPVQTVFLIFSTLAFGWIAFGSMSAALGMMPLLVRDRRLLLETPPDATALGRAGRTALLFPVYHEAPAAIAACIQAIGEDLRRLGAADKFDVFILSDTRGDAAGDAEAAAYDALRAATDAQPTVYYRRRAQNTAKKAGNIKDWLSRFGGGYTTFVILDADSVMSGETLLRLAAGMAERPRTALIQTVPRLAGGRTLFQKVQQFAAGTYGPAVSVGLAEWHRHQGNYWGHNAIIRTAAFADAAGLPELPGKLPFGGNILSHDFVEAVLLQRAGWEVQLAPTLDGSYEGAPPGLIELATRDRRWAQGNLQHMAILARPGVTRMGRIHLAMGVGAYLVSAVWAISLIVGLVLALQGQQIVPSYFEDSKTLVPIWPVIDPGAALRLFIATMAVVLLPKALGLVIAIDRAYAADDVVGIARVTGGMVLETAISMLLAPIMMVMQTVAVIQIVAGIDAGWKAQRRDGDGIRLSEALKFHAWHMVLGAAVTALCYVVAYSLIGWMAPILLGLTFAAFVTFLTARRAGPITSWLLSTEEDRLPPLILQRVAALTGEWERRLASAATAASS